MKLTDIQRFQPRTNAAGVILAAWDKVKAERLPPDWGRWRVPVLKSATVPEPSPRAPTQEAVDVAEFVRVVVRPFDSGRVWVLVLGRYQGTEILVESGVM